jgi:hypothetical protein
MNANAAQPDSSSSDSHIVVVHRVGPNWNCLFASQNNQGAPLVEDTIAVEGDQALEKLIRTKSPAQIFVILPGSDTVCRTTTLPDVENDQVIEALRLQAEAKLLGGTPSHRRAMAPLDSAVGETNRVGLIVAWPESSTLSFPSCLKDAHFIPDAVSITALLNNLRPIEPLIYADMANGTVTIALSHANGAAIRATRENSTNKEHFFEGIVRTANETALLHNHTPSFTEAMNSRLLGTLSSTTEEENMLLVPEIIVQGAVDRVMHCSNTDASWWNAWGIALGGLLAVTGSLQPLTTMQQVAIELHPSAFEKLTQRFENRTFATRLLIAAILVLALGPAIVSGIRLSVLSILHPDIEERYTETVRERQQHIVYKELAKSVWPMTKLIADITNNVPIGIDIESLQIDVGEPISIRGRAINAEGKTAAEVIAFLQEQLQATGMYKDIEFSYNPAGTYGDREFDLWATVSDSLRRPRYIPEKDFGQWTLAMQQAGTPLSAVFANSTQETGQEQGRQSDPTLTPAISDLDSSGNSEPPAYIGDPQDQERTVRTRPSGRESGAKSRTEARDSGSPKTRVPDPLSPELIKTMSRDETNIALKDVTEGLKRIGRTDPDTKKRLRTEMRLLLDRLKEVPE